MIERTARPDAFHWWIDAVGGFLTFTRDRIQIGNIGNQRNDVAVMGDLSSQHAELLREAQGWVLIAHAETKVNGRSASSFALKNGDRIAMRSVEWMFHQPLAWSRTARLELISRHRLPMGMDGVLLLSDTCVLSESGSSTRSDALGDAGGDFLASRPILASGTGRPADRRKNLPRMGPARRKFPCPRDLGVFSVRARPTGPAAVVKRTDNEPHSGGDE